MAGRPSAPAASVAVTTAAARITTGRWSTPFSFVTRWVPKLLLRCPPTRLRLYVPRTPFSADSQQRPARWLDEQAHPAGDPRPDGHLRGVGAHGPGRRRGHALLATGRRRLVRRQDRPHLCAPLLRRRARAPTTRRARLHDRGGRHPARDARSDQVVPDDDKGVEACGGDARAPVARAAKAAPNDPEPLAGAGRDALRTRCGGRELEERRDGAAPDHRPRHRVGSAARRGRNEPPGARRSRTNPQLLGPRQLAPARRSLRTLGLAAL